MILLNLKKSGITSISTCYFSYLISIILFTQLEALLTLISSNYNKNEPLFHKPMHIIIYSHLQVNRN